MPNNNNNSSSFRFRFAHFLLAFAFVLFLLHPNGFAAANSVIHSSFPSMMNGFGLISSSGNNKLAEESREAFKQIGSYQDFLFFTINGTTGLPFLHEDYLHFHSSSSYWQRENLLAHIYARAIDGDKAEEERGGGGKGDGDNADGGGTLDELIDEHLDMSFYTPTEAAAWHEKYLDWEQKFSKNSVWYKLREHLMYTDRANNILIKHYGILIAHLAKNPIEPFQMVKEYMADENEPNYAQIEVELTLANEMIAKEQKLWVELVNPRLAKFMELEKSGGNGNAEDGAAHNQQRQQQHSVWQLIAQMHGAIQNGLKSTVDKHLEGLQQLKAEQMQRIMQNYMQKFEEKQNAKRIAAVRIEEQRRAQDLYIQAQIQGLAY